MPEEIPPTWALLTVAGAATVALVGGLWLRMAGLSLFLG